jgi:hypothetical protein
MEEDNQNTYTNMGSILRKSNNLLSKENKKLKTENKTIENIIKKQNNNLNENTSLVLLKKNIKEVLNNNDILAYKILNEVRDKYLLINKINKSKSQYNSIKLPKLNLDKMILNNKKEELKFKLIELKNKKNNLDLLHNSVIQKIKDNKVLISKLKNIIEDINYKKNYINNPKEAYIKIGLLLNEKQKLIEENINTINNLKNKNVNIKKEDNINININNINNNNNEEQLKILRERNEKLKNKLNKYDSIINKINLVIKNTNIKTEIKRESSIDKKITEMVEKNGNINMQIENEINRYKKEIQKKDEIIGKLKIKYLKSKKEDLSSIEKYIL